MRRLATAVSCLALVTLTACSESEASPPPEPEDSVGATSDSANASSTPDDASQTSSGPTDAPGEDPGVPELPPEAMEDTEDGAEAFVQYYIDLINYTARYPQQGPLEQFANAECGTCNNLEEVVADLVATDRHYDGDNASVREVEALPSGGGYRVFMASDSPSYRIVRNNGDFVSEVAAGPATEVVFRLSFSDDKFLIDWIKSVEG